MQFLSISMVRPPVKNDTYLKEESADIADDKYRCYSPGVYDRVFCTNVGNEVPIGDIVEGEERGWEADDEEFLQGKEGEVIWTVFAQVSEKETQCHD